MEGAEPRDDPSRLAQTMAARLAQTAAAPEHLHGQNLELFTALAAMRILEPGDATALNRYPYVKPFILVHACTLQLPSQPTTAPLLPVRPILSNGHPQPQHARMPRRHIKLLAAPEELPHRQRTRPLRRGPRVDVVVTVQVAVADIGVVQPALPATLSAFLSSLSL